MAWHVGRRAGLPVERRCCGTLLVRVSLCSSLVFFYHTQELVTHYRAKHSKQKRFDDWKTTTFGYTFELCAEEDVASTDICQSQPVLIQGSRFGARFLCCGNLRLHYRRPPYRTYCSTFNSCHVSVPRLHLRFMSKTSSLKLLTISVSLDQLEPECAPPECLCCQGRRATQQWRDVRNFYCSFTLPYLCLPASSSPDVM